MIYSDIREALFKLSSSPRCPQSFIFYGKNISEIEKISREFSLKILGLKFLNPRDIIEFGKDKKSISVEDIRNINSEILKMPDKSNYKVVIIYNADKMNIKAQNTFLKSLEDCTNVFIILIALNISKIITTVMSRCLVVKFGTIPIEDYRNYFDKFENKLEDLYIQSGGDIDVSKSILEKKLLYKMYLHILELLRELSQKNLLYLFDLSSQINSYKDDIETFINIFLILVRDINLYLETRNEEFLKNKLFCKDIIKICESISMDNIPIILKELHNFKIRVESNLNLEICYKNFILNITEA